jgi:zinc/manganese transport system permease protein
MEPLNWTILGPAVFAGFLVLSIHVPLGQEVLKRGIIFIDLAIAQIASLGVLAAGVMGLEEHVLAVQVSAVTAALLASAGLSWTEKRWPSSQEPLIGILFVLAATGSILLLAGNPHGAQHMKDLLVGQILWTTWSSLIHMTLLYTVLLTVWYKWHEQIGHKGFYVIFAFAVTASVQFVGVYLVFASLIIPALATQRLHGRRRLFTGYLLGGLAYIAGIGLSALFDLPTGAVIVWTMAFLAIFAGSWLGRNHGKPEIIYRTDIR